MRRSSLVYIIVSSKHLTAAGSVRWSRRATNVRKAVETAVVAGAESARAGTTRCNVSILNQKPFYEVRSVGCLAAPRSDERDARQYA